MGSLLVTFAYDDGSGIFIVDSDLWSITLDSWGLVDFSDGLFHERGKTELYFSSLEDLLSSYDIKVLTPEQHKVVLDLGLSSVGYCGPIMEVGEYLG